MAGKKTPAQAAKVDRCVQDLVADPDFKPRSGTKRSAAFAVCISSIAGKKQDEPLKEFYTRLSDGEIAKLNEGLREGELDRIAAEVSKLQDAKIQRVSIEGLTSEDMGDKASHRHSFQLSVDLDGKGWGSVMPPDHDDETPHTHSLTVDLDDARVTQIKITTGQATLGKDHTHVVTVENPLLIQLSEAVRTAQVLRTKDAEVLNEVQMKLPAQFRAPLAEARRRAVAEKKIRHFCSHAEIGEPVKLSDFDGPVIDIEILREGSFNHPEYGTLEFTDKKFDAFIANFSRGVIQRDVSFDLSHRSDDGASGWLRGLYKCDREVAGVSRKILKAKVELTPMGEKAIRSKQFRYFSVEFADDWVEYKETGTHYGPVLLGGGFTNRPFIPGLRPAMLSEDKQFEFQEVTLMEHQGQLQEQRRLKPNAKIRNRAGAILPHTHPLVTDNKDHFPIDTLARGRNALARVNQFDAAPPWFKGSLEQLQRIVRRAVRRKYPTINVTGLSEALWGQDLLQEGMESSSVPDSVFSGAILKAIHELYDPKAASEELAVCYEEYLRDLGQAFSELKAADEKNDEKEILAWEDEVAELADQLLTAAREDGEFIGFSEEVMKALAQHGIDATKRKKNRKRQRIEDDMQRAMRKMMPKTPMMGEPPAAPADQSGTEAQQMDEKKLQEMQGKVDAQAQSLSDATRKIDEQGKAISTLLSENKTLKDERYAQDVESFCTSLLQEGHAVAVVKVARGFLLTEAGRAMTMKLNEGEKEKTISFREAIKGLLDAIPKEMRVPLEIPPDARVLTAPSGSISDDAKVVQSLKETAGRVLAGKGIKVKGVTDKPSTTQTA